MEGGLLAHLLWGRVALLGSSLSQYVLRSVSHLSGISENLDVLSVSSERVRGNTVS